MSEAEQKRFDEWLWNALFTGETTQGETTGLGTAAEAALQIAPTKEDRAQGGSRGS